MKKTLILLTVSLFFIEAAFAGMSSGTFKQLLKTGSPEQVQAAIYSGVDMDITQALCYAARNATQHGVLKVLVDNGASISEAVCMIPSYGMRKPPLWSSSYYKNKITTEDLLKLGASSDDFCFWNAYNMDLAIIYISNVDSVGVEKLLNYSRSQMNDTSNVNYLDFREVASYIQTIDVDLPEYKGKSKVDVALQLGQPNQEMKVDSNTEMWTYYRHADDTHYNGSVQGSSYNWGYGVSTMHGNASGGYTASNLEKYTIIFKDGAVIKAKKNYDRQLH